MNKIRTIFTATEILLLELSIEKNRHCYTTENFIVRIPFG